jgi:protocatechuate 3,4-dioxygenase beta subunit
MRCLFLLAIISMPTWACSCGGYPSAKDAWLDSPLVFIGSVDKASPQITDDRLMAGEQNAWVRVTEPFKGVRRDQVFELRDQFSSCFAGYRVGTVLLFYLHPAGEQGTWIAPACHRSRSVIDAADDLKFLRGLPDSARSNRVSGTVELYEDDPVKGFHKERVLSGVHVRAAGTYRLYESFTDAEGLYEFRDIQPGRYTIEIDYPVGTKLRFPIASGRAKLRTDDTQLEVTADSGNGFDFVLSSDTQISGRVIDPDGHPMKDVCLAIEPVQGKSESGSRIFDCTKPDGSYVLDKIPTGSYRLVANYNGRMSAAAPFGRLYYPGTHKVDQSGVVTLSAGQHLNGIDIHVPELARRIELRGRVTFSDGVPVPKQSLDFRGSDGHHLEYGRTDSEGNFVMQTLADLGGTLTSAILLFGDDAGACPQFAAKFNPKGYGASLDASPYPVAGDSNLSGIQVLFPFPSCDTWVRKQAAQK